MKVVLFCGGQGTRLRDFSETIPKPLAPLGYRPILWHVMKYYAHFGHDDFVLCLGYKGDAIKRYFLEYDECLSNDFVLSKGAKRIDLLRKDIENWRITFVDTGLNSNIGMRLKAVEPFVREETIFLANYSDGMTDFPLPELIAEFKSRKAVGMFLSVRPHYSAHFVRRASDGRVISVDDVVKADAWINGGCFVFSNEIFDYIRPGEELVEKPFERLIEKGKLFARNYEGFWRAVDTFKDLQALETLLAQGKAPWQVWLRNDAAEAAAAAAAGPAFSIKKRAREA
ncbi:MAG: glucose-1-phosphate cytidylyltransferase [Alphaproteobacteria bacterium]|nr:glucose-1-phosphate cytidylyltransferase [Alphaproteobacteria bacterium]